MTHGPFGLFRHFSLSSVPNDSCPVSCPQSTSSPTLLYALEPFHPARLHPFSSFSIINSIASGVIAYAARYHHLQRHRSESKIEKDPCLCIGGVRCLKSCTISSNVSCHGAFYLLCRRAQLSIIHGCSKTSLIVSRLSTSRSSILRIRSMQSSEKGKNGTRRG